MIYIHEAAIKRYGDSFGIRNEGLSESALDRAENGYACETWPTQPSTMTGHMTSERTSHMANLFLRVVVHTIYTVHSSTVGKFAQIDS